MRRRQFLSAAVLATSGGAAASKAQTVDPVRPASPRQTNAGRKVLFVAGHQHHSSDEDLRVLASLGVKDICSELPSDKMDEKWSVAGLMQLRQRVEGFGIRLRMVPLPLSSRSIENVEFRNIMLAKSPEREREIEHIQQMIRNCAEAGIPAVKYNLSMLGVIRTCATRGRGGASYSTFNWEQLRHDAPLTIAGELGEKTVWERITYFLERVVPVAEKCGVRMGCHPHDPGLPPGKSHRGLPRVLGSVAGLKRFVEIAPSKFHGLNFCQGSVAEMLDHPREQIYEVIRYFGSRGKIFNVHFRNIQGGLGNFRESFIDDGDMDMVQCLREYRDVGYDGMIMPDHVPSIPGDVGHRQAFAHAFGCIQASIKQVATAG